jgi:hypothetical protein
MKNTEMTGPVVHDDHLTSNEADCSDRPLRTRALVHFARNGDPFFYADGDIDFLLIDERCPSDRVYALSDHQVARDFIDELIGKNRIGRIGDRPDTEKAIREFFLATGRM